MNSQSQRAVLSRAREVGQSLARQLQPFAQTAVPPTDSDVSRVGTILDAHLAMLAESGCWGPANRLPSSAFWLEAAELMQRGSLQLHARQKPLGYAGDHVMLDRICRWDVQGEGLGRALDLYFQGQAAPAAVRNRAQVVRDQVLQLADRQSNQPCHIVSFGSGPAYDLWQALGRWPASMRANLTCTLVDMDPRALAFAEHRLRPLIEGDRPLQTLRLNLARFPQAVRKGPVFPPADFLCCAGFFDYLQRDDAIQMLQAFQQVVRPGGRWIVFNFGEHNPSRAYMEWVGNWYLQYRSPDAMNELAAAAGVRDWVLDVEPAGVNLFLQGMRA